MSGNPNDGVDENGDVINHADMERDGFKVDHYDEGETRQRNIPEPRGPWVVSTQSTARSDASLPRGQEISQTPLFNPDTGFVDKNELYLKRLEEGRAANGKGKPGRNGHG